MAEAIQAAHFPFSRLPAETQLRILQFTDLIGPSRKFIWDPKTGFTLPGADRHRGKRGSWTIPAPLFLVNRTFYQLAREIFWISNCIIIYPDTSNVFTPHKEGQPSLMPTRYAASQLLADTLLPQTLPSLRSLKAEMFSMAAEEATELAREDWFRSVEYAIDRGMNLTSLRVFRSSWSEITKKVLEETASTDEAQLRFVQSFVNKQVWPFKADGTPRAISRQLFVEMSAECIHTRYEIRKVSPIDKWGIMDQEEDEAKGRRKKPGSPTATRTIFMKERDSPDGEAETWIETLWITEIPPRDEY